MRRVQTAAHWTTLLETATELVSGQESEMFPCRSTNRTWSAVAGLLGLLVSSLFPISSAYAAAPARPGQPYAEAICSTDPNVIFCEDFNYPANVTVTSGPGSGSFTTNWINPGLAIQTQTFIFGADGLRINPASGGPGYTYPLKPGGYLPSISGCPTSHAPGGCDHVWVANFDSAQGPTGSAALWGVLRNAGGNYKNGTPPAPDFYVRFQVYFTPNWAWPGDPKTDRYNYGTGDGYDNKILYVFPPEGIASPTDSAYDAGLHTQTGTWDPVTNARYADTLAVRYGDSGGPYKMFPMCSFCQTVPAHNEYAPYQCTANTAACWRNPNDQKILGRVWRFNTGQWYTLEMRYKLSSSRGANDGLVQVWVDGTMIYNQSGLATCGGGLGDCSGVGAILPIAYHNQLDHTPFNGQQVIDNLIISRGYIGPPGGQPAGVNPSAPTNTTLR